MTGLDNIDADCKVSASDFNMVQNYDQKVQQSKSNMTWDLEVPTLNPIKSHRIHIGIIVTAAMDKVPMRRRPRATCEQPTTNATNSIVDHVLRGCRELRVALDDLDD